MFHHCSDSFTQICSEVTRVFASVTRVFAAVEAPSPPPHKPPLKTSDIALKSQTKATVSASSESSHRALIGPEETLQLEHKVSFSFSLYPVFGKNEKTMKRIKPVLEKFQFPQKSHKKFALFLVIERSEKMNIILVLLLMQKLN